MEESLDAFLESSSSGHNIPVTQRQSSGCCCGNGACAYLRHNQDALDGLEGKVYTAAQLGKALLSRHEAYIADSEKERKRMMEHVEALEAEKKDLETKNATMIEENRGLLDQLEELNSTVTNSDSHICSLQATLQSTQQEVQKLSCLGSRTERLEQQLAEFEKEQATWHSSMGQKEESEKSAVRRWQKAERTLAEVEDQIERIEQEAKEEKERHAEIVGRMERRQAVERELGSAAGRLKGAAALKGNTDDTTRSNVVSHFVKDILQDNANLQMGIVELREMLNNSNDEVETLRERLFMHQPLEQDAPKEQPVPARKDLREELNRANSQELHVHHHYHAPPSVPKAQQVHKPKKKRYGALTPGIMSSGTSTPRSSVSHGTSGPSANILQQTSASVPQQVPSRKRWSQQSNQTQNSFTLFSGPSSPQSTTNRSSSVFDRVFSDSGQDSSRPTTPDTEEPGSPIIAPVQMKKPPSLAFRTHSAPTVQRRGISPTAARPSMDNMLSADQIPHIEIRPSSHEPIPEENEAEWHDASSLEPDEENSSTTFPLQGLPDDPNCTLAAPSSYNDTTYQPSPYDPPLRRAASHESLMSVSGMDIHTLQSRPSQLLAPHAYGSRAITSQAAISSATAHATRPAALSRAPTSSRNLLSDTYQRHGEKQQMSSSLGKKVGGWVFGKWSGGGGGSNSQPEAAGSSVSSASARTPSVSSASDKHADDAHATPKPRLRPAGINQAGPIMGLGPERKILHPPVVKKMDQEGLKDVLEEHGS